MESAKNQTNPTRPPKGITRRRFLSGSLAAGTFSILSSDAIGLSGKPGANDKLNIAAIGVGGQGARDLAMMETENIVALCDVDWDRAAPTFEKYPNARKYKDFRKMFDKQQDIDAILVATCDHTHAVASMQAIKRGLGVYCEKPLAHNIWEVRQLTKAARKHKVPTQMGTQVHATVGLKTLVEMIRNDAIGKVRQVHLWSNRPMSNPQGKDRPSGQPPIPETLDWDLWLGPAPYRPYHPDYVPASWRAFCDFGGGRLGDMGCHIFDPAVWALNLKAPRTVEAYSTRFNNETWPLSTVVKYEFPDSGDQLPLEIYWYNGGIYPWKPAELPPERQLPVQGGLYIGDKGKILAAHQGGPRLLPEEKMAHYKHQPFLPRGKDHYRQWIDACKGNDTCSSNFDYAGPLTEMVLLGNVALQAGRKLTWDRENMTIKNAPEADQFLTREYRAGWSL